MRTATTPNLSSAEYGRSRVGPAAEEVNPTKQTTPQSSSPKGDQSVAAKSKPSSNTEKKSTPTKLAKADNNTADLTKKITAATKSAIPEAEKLLRKANAGKGGIAKAKVPPRTLIASLEKYVSIPAEQLIGEDTIDLDVDLDPVVENLEVPAVAALEVEEREDEVEIEHRQPATKTKERSDELTHLVLPTDEAGPETSPVADLSPADSAGKSAALQPVGMSFFERFALSAMVATEQHLSTASTALITVPTDATPDPGSTDREGEVRDEVSPPVMLEETDGVELVKNDIPPVNVSPGLDEMVISSTSQTDFDLNDSQMVFLGDVQVKSPRFHLRADKFIVHLKKDNSGMAFGEAVGNVVIDLRENGQPTGYSGLSSNAVYYPEDGKITLSGWPKIRQQFKEHVAVTRDTKMILYTDGRVKTLGRNRTVIRK